MIPKIARPYALLTLLVICLFFPSASFSQERWDDGIPWYSVYPLEFNGLFVAPALSNNDTAIVYYDALTDKLMISKSGNAYVEVGSGTSGASAFTDLTDVPASYTGQALKFVRVNAGENALEFTTASGSGDMTKAVYDTDDNNVVDSVDTELDPLVATHESDYNHALIATALQSESDPLMATHESDYNHALIATALQSESDPLVGTHESTYNHALIATALQSESDPLMTTHESDYNHALIATALQSESDPLMATHESTYTHSLIATAIQTEVDPSVDSSAKIQGIIGAGVYEPAGITESDISDLQSYLLSESDPLVATHESTYTHSLIATALQSETDPNALLSAGTDNVKDTHIDWGLAPNQVSALDMICDTANFDNNLGGTDENIQAALETIDEMIAAGFDSTTVDNTTWSDGANASNIWTFDVSGTDHTMTFGSNQTTFSGSLVAGGTSSGQSVIASGLVVNQDGGNGAGDDFRAESDTEENMILVDASADCAYFGGIATNYMKIAKGGNITISNNAEVAAGQVIISNTDVDNSTDTISILLNAADLWDSNTIFLKIIADTDGTPANMFALTGTGLVCYDDYELRVGSSTDVFFKWQTEGNDNLQIGVRSDNDSAGSGYACLIQADDKDHANRSPAGTSADPVWRVYSSDESQAEDWVQMRHNQTDGYLEVGNGNLYLDDANNTPQSLTALVKQAYINGMIIQYEGAATIYMNAGECIANGKYYRQDSTEELSTGAASANDCLYVYIDDSESVEPDVTWLISSTEPALTSTAPKIGWYNGDDRCVAYVKVSTSANVIDQFVSSYRSDKVIEVFWDDAVNMASQMNPNSAWQTPDDDDGDVLSPVNTVAIFVRVSSQDADSTGYASVTNKELADLTPNWWEAQIVVAGYVASFSQCGWIDVGASRTLRILGEDNDDSDALWMRANGVAYER